MLEHHAFIRAICDNSDDDAPRLIYADWLEEAGDPRAEFIRVQCTLASLSADHPDRAVLEHRERELLAKHRRAWIPGELNLPEIKLEFRRGFLEWIRCNMTAFVRHGNTITAEAPTVRHLLLRQSVGDDELYREFANAPALRHIATLELEQWYQHALAARLSESPLASNLRRVVLRGAYHPHGVVLLLASRHTVRLDTLEMTYCTLGDTLVGEIARLPQSAKLRTLVLRNSFFGNEGARFLAEYPHLARLDRLDLRGAKLLPWIQDELRAAFGDRVLLDPPIACIAMGGHAREKLSAAQRWNRRKRKGRRSHN